MKKLQDMCICCIAGNLDSIQQVQHYLAPKYKELVLEWAVNHDMLTPEYLPHITYNLFSSTLKNLSLYKCPQLDDAFLKQLGSSGAKFQTLKINTCKEVTGEYSSYCIVFVRFARVWSAIGRRTETWKRGGVKI